LVVVWLTHSFKALGGNIGNSLVEVDKLDLAKELIQKAKAKVLNCICLSTPLLLINLMRNANTQIANNNAIPDGWMGLDIGPQATQVFSKSN
jgi:phosphoglycerate kinase